MGYTILYTLGETQYSEENLRVTLSHTFLSRCRF
jgi:hypothetical protein